MAIARLFRLEFSGALWHVRARNDRQGAVYENDEDRIEFIDVLEEPCKTYCWDQRVRLCDLTIKYL